MENFPNASIIAAIFHFLLLLYLLKRFAFKPLANLLNERANIIATSIETAEKERLEAEQIKANYEAEMQRTREMAQEMIQKATKAGEDQAAEILANAKEESRRMKDSAVAEIQREKDKAVAEMRDQAATLAVLVASKIIDRQLDDSIKHEMVQEFVKEAGDLLC